jgi:hypothetical protein
MTGPQKDHQFDGRNRKKKILALASYHSEIEGGKNN